MQINWLSILRGWLVILVIIYHGSSNVHIYSSDILKDIFYQINIFFSFRMALFFFISGFLLYYTKIQKNSSFGVILKERIPRIIYPYLFFTIVLFSLKIIFSAHVKNPIEFSFSSFFNIFLYPKINFLWLWLWFLNAILILFLLYPILKYSLKNKYSLLCTMLICFGFNLFFPKNIHLLDLSTVAFYLLYFYSGILFSKFNLQNYFKNKITGLGFLIFFILSLFFDYNNLLHFYSGIGLSIYLSIYLSEKLPNLFSSFRNYYYQIYLIGPFFQLELLRLHFKIGNSNTYLIAFLLSALIGIYIPVLISKSLQKLKWPPLLKVMGFSVKKQR